MIERIFIVLGSNIEPQKHISQAIQVLKSEFHVIRVSKIYQSPAYGSKGQADYLNAAVLIESDIGPQNLKYERLRQIELQLGRKRSIDKYAPRTIDLDIALFGQHIIRDDINGQIIPDPGILKHSFISLPLADLQDDFQHPITKQTLGSIANKFLHLLGKEIHIIQVETNDV
ncbi:MAG: 2-amino-4-hydroxy-6-hydroxymethyldihydropteridine diphosphokinase [Candidatus Kariarchaeaceae archaeon]|jgi:2-amino-4-hydroxy-6-hydroxymethyldihydropteridine diphosphokinase